MKKIFFVLLIILLVASTSAHAFNWTRCQTATPVTGNSGDAMGVTSTTVMNSLVQSSQFTSSWGECALIGEAERVRKIFISQNLRYIIQDIAKGSGEYLEAYAALHQCSPEGKSLFGQEMKARYFQMNETDYEGAYQLLEAPFKEMKASCPLA